MHYFLFLKVSNSSRLFFSHNILEQKSANSADFECFSAHLRKKVSYNCPLFLIQLCMIFGAGDCRSHRRDQVQNTLSRGLSVLKT